MENYFLPHMGLAVAFTRPPPLLAAIVAKFFFPLSLHVSASSIHHSLFEDYVCFASVLLGPLSWLANSSASFCRVSYMISTLLEILSMVSYISFWSSVTALSIVHTAIHINAKTALIPLDPGPGVKKDPSKTFYFCDVLKFHFKRTLMNSSTWGKEEEHNNHQHMKT